MCFLFLCLGEESDREVVLVKEVTLHRMQLKSELIQVFKDTSILDFELKVRVLDARGKLESGIGEGVIRDVMCSFFQDVSSSHMTGCFEKVPTIRHDMCKEDWHAVARILAYAHNIGDTNHYTYHKPFCYRRYLGKRVFLTSVFWSHLNNMCPLMRRRL